MLKMTVAEKNANVLKSRQMTLFCQLFLETARGFSNIIVSLSIFAWD